MRRSEDRQHEENRSRVCCRGTGSFGLHRRARLCTPCNRSAGGLQGRLRLAARPAPRPREPRQLVGGVRRPAAGRPARTGPGLQPDAGRRRGAVPPVGGAGRHCARRVVPDRDRGAVRDSLAALRHHRAGGRGGHDQAHDLVHAAERLVGSGCLGQGAALGRGGRGLGTGKRGRPRECAPVDPVAAGPELLPVARGRCTKEVAGRYGRGLCQVAGAHQQPLQDGGGGARGCGAGADPAQVHAGAVARPRRAARPARARDCRAAGQGRGEFLVGIQAACRRAAARARGAACGLAGAPPRYRGRRAPRGRCQCTDRRGEGCVVPERDAQRIVWFPDRDRSAVVHVAQPVLVDRPGPRGNDLRWRQAPGGHRPGRRRV